MKSQLGPRKTQLWLLVMLGLKLSGCAGHPDRPGIEAFQKIESWVCNYSREARPEELARFDLAVLDADAHPDLVGLREAGVILVGYVSLGEVADYRWYWPEIADAPWVLEPNPNWNSRFVDVRAPEWHDLLLQRVIPRILEQGFHGLFLDTIDNAEYLEKYHPQRQYPGAMRAMTELIRKIRQRFPQVYLVANRGFALLPEIGYDLDAVVAESIFTTREPQSERFRLRTEREYRPEVERLRKAHRRFGLAVLTLDYLPADDPDAIRLVLRRARQYGFKPYVSTPALDRTFFYSLENDTNDR